MNNEEVTVEPAHENMEQADHKPIDFNKIDALRKHMLLTVDSIVKLYGVTRVSYYGWLKGGGMHKTTAAKIRRITRKLVACVSMHNWPNPAVFQASQSERLKMLEELLSSLDNQPAE